MKKIYSFKSLPSPLKILSQNKPPLLCHLNVKISNSQRLSAENQFLDLLKNIHTMEPTTQQFQACSSLPWDSGNSSYQASSPFYQCPWEAAEADNSDNDTNKGLRQHSSFTGAQWLVEMSLPLAEARWGSGGEFAPTAGRVALAAARSSQCSHRKSPHLF